MKTKKKEKKVTIKFVPNRASKSMVIDNGEELFPLYIRVIFDTKSTRFPYFYSLPLAQTIHLSDKDNFYVVSNNEKKSIKPISKETIEKETANYFSILENVIRFEYDFSGENEYNIVGIFKRFLRYEASILKVLNEELSKKFEDYLQDILTYRQFVTMAEHVQMSLLYEVPSSIQLFNFVYNKLGIAIPLSDDLKEYFLALIAFRDFKEFENKQNIKGGNTNYRLYDWIVTKGIQGSFRKFLSKYDFQKKSGKSSKEYQIQFLEEKIPQWATDNNFNVLKSVNELVMQSELMKLNIQEMKE